MNIGKDAKDGGVGVKVCVGAKVGGGRGRGFGGVGKEVRAWVRRWGRGPRGEGVGEEMGAWARKTGCGRGSEGVGAKVGA